jgi:hypothetical protein
MEASEKIFDPDSRHAREDAGQGSVRAIDSRLVIERMTIEDERSARVVRERAKNGIEAPATVRDAIEIGVRVLEREGTAAEVDYVRNELERGIGPLRDELAGTLEAGNEALAERIASSFGADRSDSVQQQIKATIAKANEEQRQAIGRLFSAEDGANPLTDFKAAMVRSLSEQDERRQRDREADAQRLERLTQEVVVLREKLGAREELDEERARGTAKGRSFEGSVAEAIEEIAGARGDGSAQTGDEAGAGGSKKGDVVVEVGAGDGPSLGRIVFEVKDSRLSKPKAWTELNGAMDARGAAFAVLVVAGEESVPAGQQELHEYEGNKLIVAVDPESPGGRDLELAYRYARCRVVLSREGELTMDAPGVRDATAEALVALADARGIRSALTSATNSVDRARGTLDAMVASVIERLERIESLVGEADTDTADAD